LSVQRSFFDMFHIGPGISPRLTHQARQRSWSADMGRGLIPGTIWKISYHNLFITYFTYMTQMLKYCYVKISFLYKTNVQNLILHDTNVKILLC
jgi:hypothetical protein